MIALLFLAGAIVWLTAAVMLSKRIPLWLGITTHAKLTRSLLFPVILVLPVADELIGQWQFHRLCEREAVVWLSPDWPKVKRAKQLPDVRREIDGYLIPINSWSGEIVDKDTGKPFFSSKSFFTRGGMLFGYFGLGLSSQATSCHPPNIRDIQKQVRLFELLKQD